MRWKTFGPAANWHACRSLRNNEGLSRSAANLVGGQCRHHLFGQMARAEFELAIGSIGRGIAIYILRRPRGDRVVSVLVLAAQDAY